MVPALKPPEASRFTIALAVFALVGATVQFRPNVPAVVIGEPVTVKSELGALRATLVTVPEPERLAQAHDDPFHCNTCLLAQVFVSERLRVPLVPPPTNPLPFPV